MRALLAETVGPDAIGSLSALIAGPSPASTGIHHADRRSGCNDLTVTDDQIEGGEADAVTRNAGQRDFTAATVVPSDFFDQLLEDLDEDAEVATALASAVERVRRAPRVTGG